MKKKIFLNNKIYAKIAIIAIIIAFIWGNSLAPADISDVESGFFTSLINSFISHLSLNIGEHPVRKIAHFTEFFILSLATVSLLCEYTKSKIRILFDTLAAGLFISFVDETIQLFVAGRSSQVSDMWIDFSGVIIAAVISLIIRRLSARQ